MKIITFRCLLISSSIYLVLSASNSAKAQIVPDSTLPQNSVVTPQEDTIQIEGGTRAGDNLFHSFEQFSVPTNNTAYLKNALEVQNIFSRITGNSISEIDGLLRANGTANLFLINPNGIIFGKNASLDIGGSFVSSTASSIHFADGTQFSSASPTQNQSLLTITAPVGLGFEQMPGNLVGEFVELQVPNGETLALVGGDLILEGAILIAAGGRIELGSVAADNELVDLTTTDQGWELNYQNIQNLRNIILSQATNVDTSGSRGGEIQVQGKQVNVADNSVIISTTFGAEPGGNYSSNGF